MLFHNVVNVRHRRGHEEGKDKGNNVVLGSPQVDVDGIEDTEERKTPVYTVYNDRFSVIRELIDDGTEEQEMDEGPDEECPWCWGEVRFFSGVVHVGGCSNGVNVGAHYRRRVSSRPKKVKRYGQNKKYVLQSK